MKVPIKVDDTVVVYESFVDDDSQDCIVAIEDKTYRIHSVSDGVFYTMLRVAGHQRSLRGSLDDVVLAVAKVHLAYRRYETRVRKSKEEAQRARDRDLNAIAETIG